MRYSSKHLTEPTAKSKVRRMRFPAWLDAEVGRASKTAAHFKVTISAVSQWRTNGVPVDRMLAVRDFTAGEVTLEDMLAPAEEPANTPAAEKAEARDAA